MKTKTLHLSFGGSLHWHRPTATTSHYSHGNEKRGERGQQARWADGASSRSCRELHLLSKTTFLGVEVLSVQRWQWQLSFAGTVRSRKGRQEKGQGHVPWGLFLPGNAYFPDKNKSSDDLHHWVTCTKQGTKAAFWGG